MSLRTEIHRTNDVLVISVLSPVRRGDWEDLCKFIMGLWTKGNKNIILNFVCMRRLDVVAIASLSALFILSQCTRGPLIKIVSDSPGVWNIIGSLKLNRLFDFFQDEATAVSSFS